MRRWPSASLHYSVFPPAGRCSARTRFALPRFSSGLLRRVPGCSSSNTCWGMEFARVQSCNLFAERQRHGYFASAKSRQHLSGLELPEVRTRGKSVSQAGMGGLPTLHSRKFHSPTPVVSSDGRLAVPGLAHRLKSDAGHTPSSRRQQGATASSRRAQAGGPPPPAVAPTRGSPPKAAARTPAIPYNGSSVRQPRGRRAPCVT